jgi:Replication-relaxation
MTTAPYALPLKRQNPPPPFKFQERDFEIIRLVYEHRFLTAPMIRRLLDGFEGKSWSYRKLQARLVLLFHHQYLEWPQAQVQQWKLGHKADYVWALGNKGADLISSRTGIRRAKVDWRAKNQTFTLVPLRHELLTAEATTGTICGARQSGARRYIQFDEILADAPARTRDQKQPDRWDVRIERVKGEPKDVRIVPDKIFGTEFLDRPAPRNKLYFFLETDLRSESIYRTNPKSVSFGEKLTGYYETALAWSKEVESGLPPRRPYAFTRFYVLTITAGPMRIASMRAHVARFPSNRRAFLFADIATLREYDGDLLALPWVDGEGNTARLGVTPAKAVEPVLKVVSAA